MGKKAHSLTLTVAGTATVMGSGPRARPLPTGTMLAKPLAMTSTRQRDDCAYRAVTELAVDANSADQARRRAARWHAWLKSPECTLQDRENFERWCSDAENAAAYVALCSDLAAGPEHATDLMYGDGFGYTARAFAVHLPRLEAERP